MCLIYLSPLLINFNFVARNVHFPSCVHTRESTLVRRVESSAAHWCVGSVDLEAAWASSAAAWDGRPQPLACLPTLLIVDSPRGKDYQSVENVFSTGVGACMSVCMRVYTCTHVCVFVTRHIYRLCVHVHTSVCICDKMYTQIR